MSDNQEGRSGSAKGATFVPRVTDRNLPFALMRAREVVMKRFRPMLQAHDITEQQWRVLRVLEEAGSLDATAVAVRANVLAPSLTRIIKNLEGRKLIARRKHSGDARRLELEITPTGVEVIESIEPHRQKIYAELEAEFGSVEMASLLNMLEKLASLRA